jgi:hypothetical protein
MEAEMAAHAFALDISNRFNFLCSPNRRNSIAHSVSKKNQG